MRRRNLLISKKPIEVDTKLYFQWGDTAGFTSGQCGDTGELKYFGWKSYKFGNGKELPGGRGMTKYNLDDYKRTLEQCDDTVRANWGCSWRMPTKYEFVALGKAVNIAWTSSYSGTTTSDGMVDDRDYVEIGGVKWATMNVGATDDKGLTGMVCTAKDGSGKVLFFPAAGLCRESGFTLGGTRGFYWSSSVNDDYYTDDNMYNAYYLEFYYFNNNARATWNNKLYRCYGFSVRGVVDE